MFVKFASADVLDVSWSPTQIHEASFAKVADFDFDDYQTDDGFMYVRVRAISSRVNKNHDSWPSSELKKAYRSFISKPLFVDHHNSDPKKARGVVVDAALHEEDAQKIASSDPYYASAPANHLPPTWIELLLEVDAKRFPKLAKAIIDKDIDGVSMGCNVERSVCSHCGNEAFSPEQYCKHIVSKGAYFDHIGSDGEKISKRSYEDCYEIGFFELSFVFDEADETAKTLDIKTAKRELIASIHAEAAGTSINRGWNPQQQQQQKPQGLSLPTINNQMPGQPGGTAPAVGGQPIGQPMPQQQMPGGQNPAMPNAQEMPFQPGMDQGLFENLPNADPNQPNPWEEMQQQKQGGLEMDDPMDDPMEQDDYGDVGFESPTRANEPQRVYQWRLDELVKAGMPPEEAHILAGNNRIDLHKAVDMLNQGATPDQVFNLLQPLDESLSVPPNEDLGLHRDVAPQMAMARTAENNPAPQSEMTSAPDKVDTLRQDQVCPICGSDMEDGICEVCNYEEPPEGFDNPDLQKAKEVDQQMRQQDADQAAAGMGDNAPNSLEVQPDPGDGAQTPGGPPLTTSNVRGTTTLNSERTSAAPKGTRINTQERPILPVARRVTDQPLNVKTLKDSKKPVESNRKKETMTQTTQKIADGASPQGEGVQADKRVDVEGVGAVTGDPLSGIEHENVEKDTGDFTAPHTDTWTGDEGDSLGQQDPVTSEGANDLGGPMGTPLSSTHTADGDRATDPAGEPIAQGGSAEEGIRPESPSDGGFPDHDPSRVDLLSDLKEEVGDRTMTWGSDDFHVTNPITHGQNGNDLGGPIGTAMASAKAQIMKAFKVAETEVELGLIDSDAKYDRVAELENASEVTLDATLASYSKVRTAGLKRVTTKTAGAGRMPSLQNRPVTSSVEYEEHAVSDEEFENSLTYG